MSGAHPCDFSEILLGIYMGSLRRDPYFLIGVLLGVLPGFIAGVWTEPFYLSSVGNGIDTIVLLISLLVGGCLVLRLYTLCDPGHGMHDRPELSKTRFCVLTVLASVGFLMIFYGIGVTAADTWKALLSFAHHQHFVKVRSKRETKVNIGL